MLSQPGVRAPQTQRPVITLAGAAALMTAAMSVTSAASTLQVGEQAAVGVAGLPAAAGIVGTAAGSVTISQLIARRDHRSGLLVGYGVALLGATISATLPQHTTATLIRVLALVAGALMIGVGNAAAQLSRYLAAELNPPARRGAAIALVVWVTAVGAVGGPLLLGPSETVSGRLGIPAGSGPFLLAVVCIVLALTLANRLPAERAGRAVVPGTARVALFTRPGTRRALVALAAAQVIMVAVMTAAPMSLHMHGSGTTLIGTVISAHVLGMFGLSPLTAVLTNRFGAQHIAATGIALLALSSAATAITTGPAQTIPLFLLGYAWNLCFIAGSTTLAAGSDPTDRLRIEGRIDAIVWGFAALAGLLSTLLLALGGTRLIACTAVLTACAAACYRTRRDHAMPEHSQTTTRHPATTSWSDVVIGAPDLAAIVRATFAIRKHATMATIAHDGSPRISGTEVDFADDGQIYLAMMPGTRRADDLRRDPRVAIHCPTEDTPAENPESWLGDGKITARAVETEPDRFRLDIQTLVLTRVAAGGLEITSWHARTGTIKTARR